MAIYNYVSIVLSMLIIGLLAYVVRATLRSTAGEIMDPAATAYAFNRTRQSFLASQLYIADTPWTRLRGLLGTTVATFRHGKGLWIVPSRGVHTLAMNYPIDVVYLNQHHVVLHLEENVRPWRVTRVVIDAASVIELPGRTIWTTHTEIGDEIEISRASEATAHSPSSRVIYMQARADKSARAGVE